MSLNSIETKSCPVIDDLQKLHFNAPPVNHEQHDDVSIHSVSTTDGQMQPPFTHISTHVSTHDAPIQHLSSFVEVPDEVYDRLPHHRKVMIVTLLSFCSFLAPISSTTILAAVPEVAHTYNSTGTIINLSNALYMLFMGLSPCFWGPLTQVYGRRIVRPTCLCFIPFLESLAAGLRGD